MKRLLILTLLVLLGTSAFGQDVSKQTERKKRIEEEIAFIDNQLKSVLGKQKASTQQLSLIQKKVSDRKALINDIDKQIAEVNDRMTAK